VPLSEKDSARLLTRNFLASYKERNKEMFVRINALDTPYAADDLREVLPALPTGIRLPKADHPDIVERLDTLLTEQEEKLGLPIGHFKIIPSIESARGVLNCVETAKASTRLVALAFGAEDYTASMEIDRTKTGEELFSARTQVVWAAKAAGIQAIDSIFSDVNDMEALRAETLLIKRLGFTGKSLVNPRQIEIIHEVFRPTEEEIRHALEVMDAIKRAREMGTGVISLKGRMVDAPVVTRAARTIREGVAFGMLEFDLSDEVIHGEK
jgi:citrate lyase subunit beta/citryl-CoA lyase